MTPTKVTTDGAQVAVEVAVVVVVVVVAVVGVEVEAPLGVVPPPQRWNSLLCLSMMRRKIL